MGNKPKTDTREKEDLKNSQPISLKVITERDRELYRIPVYEYII